MIFKTIVSGYPTGLFFGSLAGVVIFMLFDDVMYPRPVIQTKACSQAVRTLMSSTDLVEVQRSGIIIQALGCKISSGSLQEP